MIENIKVAIVDIGSNSIRMNIYEIDKDKNTKVIDKKRNILGLIGYVENNKLNADGEGKLFTVLREYLVIANQIPVDKFCAFATASLRSITNSSDVLLKIKKLLGIDIEIIDGELEAKYDNIATISRFRNSITYPFLVLDIGGGSTELNYNYVDGVQLHSVPIGSLALSKTFVKDPMNITIPEYRNIDKYIDEVFKKYLPKNRDIRTLYALGGTTRSAARMCLGERGDNHNKTDGKSYTNLELENIAAILATNPRRAKELVKKYCPERESSVLAGIFAYHIIVKRLNVKLIISSGNGVREGYLEAQIDSILKEQDDI